MQMLSPAPFTADALCAFLLEVKTLATVSLAEAELGQRIEATDPDQALVHMQASCTADEELVDLITGPNGQLCLRRLLLILRSGVVA